MAEARSYPSAKALLLALRDDEEQPLDPSVAHTLAMAARERGSVEHAAPYSLSAAAKLLVLVDAYEETITTTIVRKHCGDEPAALVPSAAPVDGWDARLCDPLPPDVVRPRCRKPGGGRR